MMWSDSQTDVHVVLAGHVGPCQQESELCTDSYLTLN